MAGGEVRKAGRRREAAIPAARDRPVERRRIAGRIGLRNRIEVELGHGSRFLCSSFVSHKDGAMQSLDLTRREGVREAARSEEHTSELQSLMRISYAVFCLKKKKTQ